MDPHDPADEASDVSGERVSHYRLLGPLGRGGMGEVYRARDEVLQREVAVKLLPRVVAGDAAARARLLREARLASALSHPGICTVFEAGEHEGRVFLAMQLIDGHPLEDLIVPGGMSASAVAKIGVQVADALAHAHAHGVIHRDLKPSNVMITADGHARILDFGVSRRLDSGEGAPGSTTLTETGAMVGTLGYLPPEVLHGRRADARGDMWALGVMLHRLLTGEAPFGGATGYALTASILNDAPAPLPQSVPAPIRQIVSRCLEKDPARRPASAAEVRDALAAGIPAPTPLHGSRLRSFPALRIGLAAAAIVVVVALGWVLRSRMGGGVGSANQIRSIAVLPLANLSGDATQEYFADGMTAELIQTLSRVSALSVISRTSVLGYKGTRKPPRDIGRELGVRGLIEGTVQRGSDRVKVALSLIEASSGRALWSRDYERPMTDVLALQSDVAQEVVQEMAVTLRPEEHERLSHRSTVNPQAYEAYLRARSAWEGLSLEDVRASVDLYGRAIALDSTFAPAYAGRATTYYVLSNWYWPPDTAMPLARQDATRALALDPDLAEGHSVLGMVAAHYDWEFERAEGEYGRALALDPSSSRAHEWYGYFLIEMGRFADAQVELDHAVRLDPLDQSARFYSSWPQFYEEHYDSVRVRLADLLRGAPDFWGAHGLLGETLEMQGDLPGALDELEKAREEGNPWIRCAIARVFARQGRIAECRRELASLDSLSRTTFVTPYGLASVYMALGDRDRAFELLDRGLRQRSEDLMLLGVDPRMKPLRSDPRFVTLMRRVGLPTALIPATGITDNAKPGAPTGPASAGVHVTRSAADPDGPARARDCAQPLQRSPYASASRGSRRARIARRSAVTPL